MIFMRYHKPIFRAIFVGSCSNVISPLHVAVKLSMFSCLMIPEMVYSSLFATADGQSSSIAIL